MVGWLFPSGPSRSHEQISARDATSESSRRRTGSANAPRTRASSMASCSESGASTTEAQHSPSSSVTGIGVVVVLGTGSPQILTVVDTCTRIDIDRCKYIKGTCHGPGPTCPERDKPGRGDCLLLHAVRHPAGQGPTGLRQFRGGGSAPQAGPDRGRREGAGVAQP